MSRRASLPGAAELFRSTAPPPSRTGRAADRDAADRDVADRGRPTGTDTGRPAGDESPTRHGSGRQRHDTKITVYVSAEELLALEQARLTLRAAHGLAVDRGRVVREAIAMLLGDFEEHGDDSALVRRLRRDPQR